jgi:hypothetical protein
LLWYLLLTVLPIAAAAYLVWFYRKKSAERAAASRKRFAEMFGPNPSARPAPLAPESLQPAPLNTGAAMPTSTPGGNVLCTRKVQLLSAKGEALFEALRTALPGHFIFPHVSLAAVVELPPAIQGREREQRQRGLAQNTIDLLVCDPHKRPVAAIDFTDVSGSDSIFKVEYLKAASLLYVRVNDATMADIPDLTRLILQAPAHSGHSAHS